MGSYNKIFLLELDNGIKATARIPGPLVGNLQLSVASEAATMSYLYETGGASIPKLLTWNASADNAVKSPYLVTEFTPGTPLGDVWTKIRGPFARKALNLIIDNQIGMATARFSQIGSLYFKEDVSPELQDRPLFAKDFNHSGLTDVARKYRIGPIADREWWRGARRDIDGDRGPWPDTASYIVAAARFQKLCIAEGVDSDSPHMCLRHEDSAEIEQLLDMCIAAAPHLAPLEPRLTAPTLAHPNLSGSNIIIDAHDLMEEWNIVGWQVAYKDGALLFPNKDSKPVLPKNINCLPAEEQKQFRAHLPFAKRQWRYISSMAEYIPEFAAAWGLPHWAVMCQLMLHINRCGAMGPLLLRQNLIELEDIWPGISSSPCPFHFSEEERTQHKVQFAMHEHYESAVDQLQDFLGCDRDGWVPNDRYQDALWCGSLSHR
ncbi:hypothetical protein H0H81_000851 [Sphagnurus paluster]|uniref:Altered inheritance of mitochondria protein 9, mitochondrial n=1 Tax=Sphagnurus paluster TaxID=117069 RepID=A0A9P7GMK7_9AGAR|nr:hypothetical protein H0H81_000851 [Sphagnurus paluster]